MDSYTVTNGSGKNFEFVGELLVRVSNIDEQKKKWAGFWSEYTVFIRDDGQFIAQKAHFSLNEHNHYIGINCADIESLVLFFDSSSLAKKLYLELSKLGYPELEYFAN
ncbi:hypothetical protein [Vibrio furnissii]|uniref:hypothetical protein n=1 Tax=Vibrio furnissii TaxID=29494 RepID=UPI001EEB4572|nr:hypothetical protein [Vibrio furnissii]MCG6268440.1 hypothetical protein [Vibrio furnissii]